MAGRLQEVREKNLQLNTNITHISNTQLEEKSRKKTSLEDVVLVDEPYWKNALQELTHIMPEGVYLTQLKTEEKTITIKGNIISNNPQTLLTQFMQDLEKGIFKDIQLIQSEKINKNDNTYQEFTLTGWAD